MSPSQTLPTYMANLDFEYEWSAHLRGLRYQPSKIMRGVCARWERALGLVDDALHAADMPIFWGLTPALGQTLSASQRAALPSLEAVQRVNDKRFSHELEQRFGVALPHARLIDTREALDEALATCPWDWILKHPWGVSGREQVRGRVGIIDVRHSAWVDRQFAHGDVLIFEPWMADVEEFSMHFSIARGGEITRLGACRLVTDRSGTYRGNQCGPDITGTPEAWAVAERVVQAAADEGYFGPLGIDAMWGALDGVRQLRPLMEINARHSFGRLTLGLGQYVPPGWSYAWWHPNPRDARQLENALQAQGQVLPTIEIGATDAGFFRLPLHIDPGGESGTFVLASPL